MTGSDIPEIPGLLPAELPVEGGVMSLLTRIGSAVDAVALQAARLAIDATLMPPPEEFPRMLETAAPFLSSELRADPGRFLAFEDDEIGVAGQREKRRRSLDGGAVISRRLSVPYAPYFDSATSPGDDAVRLEHWAHFGEWRRPTILALHGFGMGYPGMGATALFARELYGHGFDVVLMTLPYHGRRTPPDARFSGQYFTSVDVSRFNEAVRRAAFEILAVERWLRARRGDPVGLMGLSLGGYLASLVAGLQPRLDFVVPMVPPVCIGDLGWRFLSRSRHYAEGALPSLYHDLRMAYRVHSPLTYPLVVARERVLIIAGRGDQVVPPEHPHSLWRHWGEPDIHWFSGSHLAPFRRGELVARIVAHVSKCCR